ncbi:hypothetical protein M3672_07950 [Microbacterium enclense]|uniref:hypothetical protein n=1 Tax=Microbacterium enclense TaxID=993073 RepID=UPI002040127E|nr:hypothetical protein [Microbacterium enclense]MCM3614372.1 hypothetical protein [Microbacterium enclense]
MLARFAYDADAVDALKSSRTAEEWAAWVDEIGGWRVPRAVWRRAEQRLRALSFDIVPLSLPDPKGVDYVVDSP